MTLDVATYVAPGLDRAAPRQVNGRSNWNGSRIDPGTPRDLFVYTPAQLTPRHGGALFADSIRWLRPRTGAPS